MRKKITDSELLIDRYKRENETKIALKNDADQTAAIAKANADFKQREAKLVDEKQALVEQLTQAKKKMEGLELAVS